MPADASRRVVVVISVLLAWASDLSAQDPPATQPASRPATQPTDAPRPRPARLNETVVTATRLDTKVFDVPYTAHVIGSEAIQNEMLARSMPEALREVPGVMVQKTSHGQASPFLRGFTGYGSLFLIDGVRLNNSTFRSGPNQYSSTVDQFSVESLEVVLGPSSVLYGSDALGGTVNALTRRRTSFEPGVHADGRFFMRWSDAESSFIERLEGSANVDDRVGIFAGVTYKDFGDLRAGGSTGIQPNTGYWDLDGDLHLDFKLDRDVKLTTVYQHVDQDHVPRTHTTVSSKSFAGTALGTELRRDHDQTRDLFYVRVERREENSVDGEQLTVSYHRQQERRDRIRTATQRDISAFDVHTPGVQFQIDRETSIGILTAGLEYTHDFVTSFKRNYVTGAAPVEEVQGTVGDDSAYDLAGVYLQDRIAVGDFEFIPGVRWNYAHADANEVDNPAVPGTSPNTPGNTISIDDSWNEVTGSLRGLYHAGEHVNLFAGVSQGFRAPSLSDLTALDETSGVEFPTPGLRPERYLQEEVGVKVRDGDFAAQVSYFEGQLDGFIVPSPTGAFVGPTPVVAKSNVGDGRMHGAEALASLRFAELWSGFASAAWQEGKVEQYQLPSGVKTKAPISRLLPLTGVVGLRFGPADGAWYLEALGRGAEKQDKLSFKDHTDTQRIPPGGTPGYVVGDLRAGVRITPNVRLTAALENFADKNYRVHGSGVNEAGINFILGVDIRF